MTGKICFGECNHRRVNGEHDLHRKLNWAAECGPMNDAICSKAKLYSNNAPDNLAQSLLRCPPVFTELSSDNFQSP